MTIGVVIIGSGNIGTDLLVKIEGMSQTLHLAGMMVGGQEDLIADVALDLAGRGPTS